MGELTIGAAISILIGLVMSILQFSIPSLEGTLLSLTKDIIMEVSSMPTSFNFIIVTMINVALMAIPIGSFIVLRDKFQK